jgi:hypothetical protein
MLKHCCLSVDGLLLQGAVAAGMRVVVVPSLVESHDEFKAVSQEEAAADGKGGTLLASLLLTVWCWCSRAPGLLDRPACAADM